MIDKTCFTKEWMDAFRKQKEHGTIQTVILEKMIYALHLLELLKMHGLNFVFKGGTSLILLLEEGNRFSIDIDIISKTEREALEKILDTIVEKSLFTSVSLDEKRSYNEGVPKAHYIFGFESVYNPDISGTLLLDILTEETIYPEIIERPVQSKWIKTNETVYVKTPSVDAITGDKLTAFAPNTIGIPYYKGEEPFTMEISKQLFDLGQLFPQISNMEVVQKSFHAFAEQEIGYRKQKEAFRNIELTPKAVLKDVIDTCVLITKRERNRMEPEKSQFKLMMDGIKKFGTGYLMSGSFRIDEAVVASARIAHLAAKLLTSDMSPIQTYQGEDIQSLIIEDPDWNFLNRLKRQPDKSSFYYWYHTVRLLT